MGLLGMTVFKVGLLGCDGQETNYEEEEYRKASWKHGVLNLKVTEMRRCNSGSRTII